MENQVAGVIVIHVKLDQWEREDYTRELEDKNKELSIKTKELEDLQKYVDSLTLNIKVIKKLLDA